MVLYELTRRFNKNPIESKLNIIAARCTEGLSPVMIAYSHIPLITTAMLKKFHRKLRNGIHMSKSIDDTMPTCNPETAKICMAPADAKEFFVCASNNDLLPNANAYIIDFEFCEIFDFSKYSNAFF